MSKRPVSLLLTLALITCAVSPAFALTDSAAASSGAVSEGSEQSYVEDITSDSACSGELSEEEAAEKEAAEKAAKEAAEKEAAEKAAKEAAEKAEKEAAEKAEKEKARKYRNGLAAYIRSVNKNWSVSGSRNLAQYFIDAGEKYNLDPVVLIALAQRESTFRSKVTSSDGHKGMLQVSNSIANKYGYKASSMYTSKKNIDAGSHYLSSLKKTFGNYTKSLSAYMYGSAAVKKGKYSKSAANSILNTRKKINSYLEKHNYV